MVEKKVLPRFISVDGVDGIGKFAMAEALRQAIFDSGDMVKILSVTEKLSEEKRLMGAFQQAVAKNDLERMQNIYLATWNRLAEDIKELLSCNYWVILNSSPIRSVAFYKEINGLLYSIANKRWKDGTITGQIIPGIAVLLKANPELVLNRLSERSSEERAASYDPKDLGEVEARSRAYELVFKEKYESIEGVNTTIIDVSGDDKGTFNEAVDHYLAAYATFLIK